MVRMPTLPIGQNHDPGSRASNHARDFQSIDPSVFDSSVGDIESLSPLRAEKPRSFAGFAFTVFGGSSCSHFAAGEVENSCAPALLRHLQQGAATGLFHIVAVRGDCQDVQLSTKCMSLQCFRSTKKCAKSLRVLARAANESSAAQPEAISASALRNDSSMP